MDRIVEPTIRRIGTALTIVAVLSVAVCVSSSAWAQASRTITVLPIKFQNDLREPETRQQIEAWWAVWPPWTEANTGGVRHLTVNVLPYVTIPIDRQYGLNEFTQDGTDKGCYQNPQTRLPWTNAAYLAADAAGMTLVDQPWVYSPQTFGLCSHIDRLGYMVERDGFTWYYAIMLGLSFYMPAWTTICTDDSGAFVPLSKTCAFGVRTFQSVTGQGNGGFTCAERSTLNALPSAVARTVPLAATLPQSFVIAPLEQAATGNEIHCLTVDAFRLDVFVQPATIVISGVTFELHRTTLWSRDWQTGGLSGHVKGSSRLLDFTPDGKLWNPGEPATTSNTLNPGTSFTFNGVTVSVGEFTPTGALPVTVSSACQTACAPQPPGKVSLQ